MRRPDIEHRLLKAGEQRVGLEESGFAARVMARLDVMQEEKGDECQKYGPARFAREIEMECLDLGGWPAKFYEQLQLRPMNVKDQKKVELLLRKIAALGARGDQLCQQLLELCDE